MTAQPTPATAVPLRSRRRRRLVAVAIVLSLIAVVLGGRAYREHQRALALESAIREVGGELTLSATVWQAALARFKGVPVWAGTTGLNLDGVSIDAQWLSKHDNLRPLQITWLSLGHSPADGAELVALAREHPIYQFDAWSVPNIDALAAAFHDSRTLRLANLTDSDLTDTGLRQLPLDELVQLCLSGTKVTPDGLNELHRCALLNQIQLDGRQFDASVHELLMDLPRKPALVLRGRSVTDAHLLLLHGTDLQRVRLEQTSATKAAADSLQSSAPDCHVDFAP